MQVMGKNLNQTISIKVQTLRKLRGITQEQLAEKIDKTVETVSNIERGKKLPGLATLDSIRMALGVSLSELIDVSSKKPDRGQLALETKAKFLLSKMNKKELSIAVAQLEALLGD
jgi:transcriptional regulator with XRE-family HTH domain